MRAVLGLAVASLALGSGVSPAAGAASASPLLPAAPFAAGAAAPAGAALGVGSWTICSTEAAGSAI